LPCDFGVRADNDAGARGVGDGHSRQCERAADSGDPRRCCRAADDSHPDSVLAPISRSGWELARAVVVAGCARELIAVVVGFDLCERR
jgi:hypothetical protein